MSDMTIDTTRPHKIDWRPIIDACEAVYEAIREAVKWAAECIKNFWIAINRSTQKRTEREVSKARVKAIMQKLLTAPRRIYWYFAHRRHG